MATLRQEQPSIVAGKSAEWLVSKNIRRIGLDTSLVSLHVSKSINAETELIDSEIWQMRRCKDPDELELMKKAIGITEKMYQRAIRLLRPASKRRKFSRSSSAWQSKRPTSL